MILTYKYRLNPTKMQSCILNDILFQMQQVYNDALNERRWYWNRSRKPVAYIQQAKRITQERKINHCEMNLLNAASIQQMLRRLDKAYRAFYKGIRGLPRFKGRNRFKSVEYRHGDGCKVKGDRLYIQHVGDIKVRLHRPLPQDAVVKQVILKRSRNKWDACFQIELPDPTPEPHAGPAVGIDVGLMRLATLSDGNWLDNPRWLRQALAKKRVLNRKLSRQKRYGSGWRKTVDRIAKLDAHIANQRKEFWHKATYKLTETYGTIVIEDLNLAFMTRNGKLSLSAHDAGLGMLKSVNVRTHNCPDCGIKIVRDINAALNILGRGYRLDRLTYPVAESVLSEAPLL